MPETFWESQSDNQWTYLRNGTPEISRALYNELKVRQKDYYFSALYRSGMSDGYTRYFDQVQQKLLTGMVPYAQQLGFDYPEVVLAEKPVCELQDVDLKGPDGSVELNEYQQEGVRRACYEVRRGVFDHCTAAGKTYLAAALCSVFRTLQVTLTVPSIGLLEQNIEEFRSLLKEPIGQLGGGKKDFEGRIVVVYDGFLKQYNKSPFVKNLAFRTQLLLTDELQTATKKLFPFFRQCKNAYYRYGFSGSFFELDDERIFNTSGYFGATITKVDDSQTKDAGRSVPPHFIFLEYAVRDTSFFADYKDGYEQCLVENEPFNRYMAQQLAKPYEDGLTVLVLVKRVAHCSLFQAQLEKLGIESEIYNGGIKTEVRRQMRAQFKRGLIPVLIATEQTMGVGINIPLIEVLMNLGGGLSNGQTKQKYGRSIRSFDEKQSVTIYEPYLTNNRWFLKHSKARLAMAKKYATGNVKLRFYSGVEQVM